MLLPGFRNFLNTVADKAAGMAAADLEFPGNVRGAYWCWLTQEPAADFPLAFADNLQGLVDFPNFRFFSYFLLFRANEEIAFQAVSGLNAGGQLYAAGFENYPKEGDKLFRLSFFSGGYYGFEGRDCCFLVEIVPVSRNMAKVRRGDFSDKLLVGSNPL